MYTDRDWLALKSNFSLFIFLHFLQLSFIWQPRSVHIGSSESEWEIKVPVTVTESERETEIPKDNNWINGKAWAFKCSWCTFRLLSPFIVPFIHFVCSFIMKLEHFTIFSWCNTFVLSFYLVLRRVSSPFLFFFFCSLCTALHCVAFIQELFYLNKYTKFQVNSTTLDQAVWSKALEFQLFYWHSCFIWQNDNCSSEIQSNLNFIVVDKP